MKDKVDELTELYQNIKQATEERNIVLGETLEVSDKFWVELNQLMGNLKEMQDTADLQEAPAIQPDLIREQQEVLEVFD